MGASFGLSIFLFGFVAMAGLLLAAVALPLLIEPRTRRTAYRVLIAAAVVLSGPLIYAALALL